MASRLTAKGFIPIFEQQIRQLFKIRDEKIKKGQPVDRTIESINDLKKYVEFVKMDTDDEDLSIH